VPAALKNPVRPCAAGALIRTSPWAQFHSSSPVSLLTMRLVRSMKGDRSTLGLRRAVSQEIHGHPANGKGSESITLTLVRVEPGGTLVPRS